MTNSIAQGTVLPDETLLEKPKITYLKDYQPPHYWVDTVDLVFDLKESETDVKTTLTLRRNKAVSSAQTPLILYGEELLLQSLQLDGRPVSSDHYTLTTETLTLHTVPETFTLEIRNRIHPEKNTELSGLYRKTMYCTQCEAEGFRRITFFPDRPDIMAKFTTTIIADKVKCPVLLSNGNCIAKGSEGDRHWAKWEDPWKKPCYLFALVAGDLVAVEDHYLTRSGRLVTLKLFVDRENQDRCQHALSALKKAMKWDEETYGREYDLDIYMIVAINDFNMGAMENKGLNVFNAKYILARPETATDSDFEHIDAVVGHEYFHNWSGNRVTCRDWFQLSLKEGLTVFREHQFMQDITESPVSLIERAATLRASQFPEDAGPLAHPVRPEAYVAIDNFYTSTVYEKGAEVINMLKTLLGWETFRKGMDLYFERHDGQAVTTDDFVKAMEDASKVDLKQFKLWYSQAGTPEITVTEQFDAVKRQYHLTLKQNCPPTPNQPEKQPMLIPVRMNLLNAEGADLLEQDKLLKLTEKEQTFTFSDLPEKPILSIFRGFSAPVKVVSPLTDEQLAFLSRRDSDAFNRWDAGQMLSERIVLRLIQDAQGNIPLKLNPLWTEVQRAILPDKELNPALKVELLRLPSTHYLIEKMEVADPDAIYAAKRFLIMEIAKLEKQLFWDLYHSIPSPHPYQYTTELSHQRQLKNFCLYYLAQHQDAESMKVCLQQWKGADNMTDKFAVLSILSDLDCPEREQVMTEFYDYFAQDALVVNKWLRVQATSVRQDTLAVVQQLMNHPAFDITNPNKVYALIGAFSGNPVRFHEKTGQGYRFLADAIIQLNVLNPQVASRMMDAFTRWRRFDKSRQEKMSAELQRIKAAPKLSKDVLEVVDKCLA